MIASGMCVRHVCMCVSAMCSGRRLWEWQCVAWANVCGDDSVGNWPFASVEPSVERVAFHAQIHRSAAQWVETTESRKSGVIKENNQSINDSNLLLFMIYLWFRLIAITYSLSLSLYISIYALMYLLSSVFAWLLIHYMIIYCLLIVHLFGHNHS